MTFNAATGLGLQMQVRGWECDGRLRKEPLLWSWLCCVGVHRWMEMRWLSHMGSRSYAFEFAHMSTRARMLVLVEGVLPLGSLLQPMR